jgi:hypothetical protein
MLRTASLALVLFAAVATAAIAEDEKGKGGKGNYVHCVIFTLKKGAPDSAVEDAIADCHKLLAKIKSVRSVKAGRPAKEAEEKWVRKDYHFGLLVIVDDHAGLKAYLEDPLHVEFVKKHGKHLDMDKLAIFDFHNQKK